jgi:hypothetical protein
MPLEKAAKGNIFNLFIYLFINEVLGSTWKNIGKEKKSFFLGDN